MDTTPPAPAGEPRPRDAEATRRALLRAARGRFTVLGYDRTTTRDVAHDAGVNLMLINRYFGGKPGLFQAVVAASPDPLAEDESSRGDIVDDFLDGLRPDAWPEFGSHPMLLLLRDSSVDEEIQDLRTLAMDKAVERIVASGRGDSGGATAAPGPETRLRAQLLLALFSGVVALRSMAPVEPLASVEADDLRSALEDAIDALIGPARHTRPSMAGEETVTRSRAEGPRSAPIVVRAAERDDVSALVRLRVANAERHVRLDPVVYRVPESEAVRGHFQEALSAGSTVVILVAEVAGKVVGMVELVPLPDPPDHQILVPRRAADVHTVVLEGHRGEGVGSALLTAAERTAAERGISIIHAGIFARNEEAARFYSSAGFRPRGTLLSKELGSPSAG
ncbi:GNAT family N-acetyltransferase [Streptomyces sp. NPDC059215]|uniref:GNAT family N-acetyltransferase n=1 Tax=Streptomyces sp. NPDC059215 TaxID=3346772 RepID=UPI0036C1C637